MFVYLTMLCGIALIYYFCHKTAWNEKKKKRNFLIFSGILIILILGSRWYGYEFADTGMYIRNFDKSKLYYSLDDFLHKACEDRDPGYYTMVWILARIIPSAQVLIYFECAFFVFGVFLFIYYTTDQPLIAVFLFFGTGIFSFYMSAFRQAFAFSFCLLSYLLLQKVLQGQERGNFFRLCFGLLLFYLAITMHKSAIIFIIAILICLIKNRKLKIFAVLVSSLLIIWFRDAILSSGNDALDRDYETVAALSTTGFIIQIIIFAFPMILLMFIPKKISLKENMVQEVQYNNLLAIAVVGVVFYVLRAYALAFERVASYFTITTCSLYPVVFKRNLSEKAQNELTWCICILCSALFLWRVADAGPFIFFWQK